MIRKGFKKLVRFFSSLQLAVITLLLLSILICIGTIVESRYDATAAKVFVYGSVWMNLTMGMLVISLIAVIASRWPWQKKHAAFIFAHIGVIMIIVGAVITQRKGIDGTIRLLPGEKNSAVTVSETELILYRSKDGANYDIVHSEPVEFLKNPIKSDRPFLIKTKDAEIEIAESVPYALPKQNVQNSLIAQSGAGLRFQMTNNRIQTIEWLVQRNVFEKINYDMGPVLLSMGGLWDRNLRRHEIRLVPKEKGAQYAFYRENEKDPAIKGDIAEGEKVTTPWMGLEFRMLRYFPKAEVKWDLEKLDHPTPQSVAALKVRQGGYENWLFLNDYLKIFTDKHVYLLSYRNRQVDLGFPLELKEFRKSQYPGSTKAMAYESSVSYGDGKEVLISMNEPLQHEGFSIYQAGFDQLPNSSQFVSILSVNKDPGRVLKYLGSLIMSIGILLLFYFRKQYSRK
ncbi:cytochrome c biogenesis protein ResB [Bdellovibrio sp. HCB274]|uniref:cytochrome c biogenesis protein ResB n=1 Tax=Bdellovibrio sp. HCB274 TaxID=3394361 RepID=UPI0039B415AA